MVWNCSFMISTRDTKSMPSELSKPGNQSCLLYYMVTSIKQKVNTLKHGLNIGHNIYKVLIIRLQV